MSDVSDNSMGKEAPPDISEGSALHTEETNVGPSTPTDETPPAQVEALNDGANALVLTPEHNVTVQREVQTLRVVRDEIDTDMSPLTLPPTEMQRMADNGAGGVEPDH